MLKIVMIALLALCTTFANAQQVPSQPEETQYFELNCDDLGDEASVDEFQCVIEQPLALESEPLYEVVQEVEISATDSSIVEDIIELPNGTSVPLSQLMIGDPDPKCIDTDISIIHVTDIPPGLILFNNRTNSFLLGFAEYGGLNDLGAAIFVPIGPMITLAAVWDGVEWVHLIDPAVVPDSPIQDIKQPDC